MFNSNVGKYLELYGISAKVLQEKIKDGLHIFNTTNNEITPTTIKLTGSIEVKIKYINETPNNNTEDVSNV